MLFLQGPSIGTVQCQFIKTQTNFHCSEKIKISTRMFQHPKDHGLLSHWLRDPRREKKLSQLRKWIGR